MSALYLPLNEVVTIIELTECSAFCLIEDFVGHTHRVLKSDLRILSVPEYEGIC